MTDEQLAVLRRVEAFEIDAPGATNPFSRRLAKENGWSPEYTARVIAEYRRYAFLSVAAGHPVSPSHDVDEAWHLHMLYSENYWDGFCGKALGRPLHHRPTQGIAGDGAQYEDWYAKTLASYRRLFGEPPPADIWTVASEKRVASPDYVKVDRRRHWVIAKPDAAAARRRTGFAVAAALCLVLIGCTDAVKGANPLDWSGPDFLQLYAVMFVVCYGLAWGLRSRLRLPLPGMVPPADLGPYEVTFLIAGGRRCVEAAVANLARQGQIAIDPATNQIVAQAEAYSGKSDLERNLFEMIRLGRSVNFYQLQGIAGAYVGPIHDDLVRKGLIMPAAARGRAAQLPLLLAFLPIVVGVVKIAVGVSRDRPVGILVGLGMLSAIVALISFARRPYLSRYGEGVKNDLLTRYAFLRGASMADIAANADPESEDFLLAVGLFGPGILLGSPFNAFGMAMAPPMMIGGIGGASCSGGSSCNSGGSNCNAGGSSCNSGSDSGSSGGSSCSSGGDSGGGGGCGGCSGGGGCSS